MPRSPQTGRTPLRCAEGDNRAGRPCEGARGAVPPATGQDPTRAACSTGPAPRAARTAPPRSKRGKTRATRGPGSAPTPGNRRRESRSAGAASGMSLSILGLCWTARWIGSHPRFVTSATDSGHCVMRYRAALNRPALAASCSGIRPSWHFSRTDSGHCPTRNGHRAPLLPLAASWRGRRPLRDRISTDSGHSAAIRRAAGRFSKRAASCITVRPVSTSPSPPSGSWTDSGQHSIKNLKT
jgi:hypothetical protein